MDAKLIEALLAYTEYRILHARNGAGHEPRQVLECGLDIVHNLPGIVMRLLAGQDETVELQWFYKVNGSHLRNDLHRVRGTPLEGYLEYLLEFLEGL